MALTWGPVGGGNAAGISERRKLRESCPKGHFLAIRKGGTRRNGARERGIERKGEPFGYRGRDRGDDEEGAGRKGKFRRAHLFLFLGGIDQRPRETD